MGFGEAIKVVLFEKYANFSGRARRAEYWWFILFTFIVSLITSFFTSVLVEILPFDVSGGMLFDSLITFLVSVVLLVPGIAVEVRRLHDRDMSGSWAIAPAVVQIIATFSSLLLFVPEEYLVFLSNPGPILITCLLGVVILLLISMVISIMLMFRGTHGSNKYGADPLGVKIDANIFQ